MLLRVSTRCVLSMPWQHNTRLRLDFQAVFPAGHNKKRCARGGRGGTRGRWQRTRRQSVPSQTCLSGFCSQGTWKHVPEFVRVWQLHVQRRDSLAYFCSVYSSFQARSTCTRVWSQTPISPRSFLPLFSSQCTRSFNLSLNLACTALFGRDSFGRVLCAPDW